MSKVKAHQNKIVFQSKADQQWMYAFSYAFAFSYDIDRDPMTWIHESYLDILDRYLHTKNRTELIESKLNLYIIIIITAYLHMYILYIYANYVHHTVLLLYYVYDDDDYTVGLLAVHILLCPSISLLAYASCC